MDLFKAIAVRKATRAYKPNQVSAADLNSILKAGCAAPVGMNAYDSLHLTVVQNQALLDKINQAAAKAIHQPEFKALYDAPTLVVVSAKASDMMPNIEYANSACVIENMLLAATALGVDSIYIWAFMSGLFAEPDLMTSLGIPAGYKPASGLLLGYAKNPSSEEKELNMTIGLNIIQ